MLELLTEKFAWGGLSAVRLQAGKEGHEIKSRMNGWHGISVRQCLRWFYVGVKEEDENL